MHDRHTEPAVALEHTGGLPNRAFEVLDILERHERDNEIEGVVAERQRSGIGEVSLQVAIRLAPRGQHRRRRIDSKNQMAARFQIAGQPAFPAAEV